MPALKGTILRWGRVEKLEIQEGQTTGPESVFAQENNSKGHEAQNWNPVAYLQAQNQNEDHNGRVTLSRACIQRLALLELSLTSGIL